MNTVKKLFAFLLLGAIIYSCGNSDDWSPPAPLGPDNPGAFFDFGVRAESVTVEPDDTYFVLTLRRAENKSGTAFQLPITIVENSPYLNIPTTVTFAAGSTTTELRIAITTELEIGYSLEFVLEFDSRYFDPWAANGNNRFNGRVTVFQAPTLGPVTPENIARYVQEDDVETVPIFADRSVAVTFNVILKSPRLLEWQEDYRTLFPLFSHYGIRIRRSTAQDSFTAFYEPAGQRFWGQPEDNSGMIHPLRTAGANPLTDAVIIATRESGSGAPTGWGAADVAAGLRAFMDFVNQEEGFTIIQDWDEPTNIFWFRSRLDPNDWFKVERQ